MRCVEHVSCQQTGACVKCAEKGTVSSIWNIIQQKSVSGVSMKQTVARRYGIAVGTGDEAAGNIDQLSFVYARRTVATPLPFIMWHKAGQGTSVRYRWTRTTWRVGPVQPGDASRVRHRRSNEVESRCDSSSRHKEAKVLSAMTCLSVHS
jgi:hypothetical protein